MGQMNMMPQLMDQAQPTQIMGQMNMMPQLMNQAQQLIDQDNTLENKYRMEGFDYPQEINWSPGQPAPEGYRVVNKLGDTYIERMYPSKEEMSRMGGVMKTPMGGIPMPMGLMMPPSGNYADNFQDPDAGLSGQEIAEKYGIPYASGGRVGQNMGGIMRAGYAMGTPLPNDPTKPINPFGPKPTGPVLPSNNKMADRETIEFLYDAARDNFANDMFGKDYGDLNEEQIEEVDIIIEMELGKRQVASEKTMAANGGLMRTGYANGSEDFQNYLKGRKKFESEMNLEQLYREYQEDKRRQKIKKQKTMAADGGLMRLNYMIGGEAKQMEAGAPPIMYSGNMDPNAQAGLPSTPGPIQMAEDGPEFDMREEWWISTIR